MNHSIEAVEGGFLINNFGVLPKLYKKIAKRTNRDLNAIDPHVTNIAFALGIEETLREMAILKMRELEDKRSAIESNAAYSEVWNTLHCLNDEIYDQLGHYHVNLTDENFILGFLEGYRMMKVIAENGE